MSKHETTSEYTARIEKELIKAERELERPLSIRGYNRRIDKLEAQLAHKEELRQEALRCLKYTTTRAKKLDKVVKQQDEVYKVMKEISVWRCGHCTSAQEILDKLIAAIGEP